MSNRINPISHWFGIYHPIKIMAFGTGSAEYLIALAVFVALLAIAFYLVGTKTYVEKGLYWGTYHTFFGLMILFLIGT
jgi:hypothetical protein